MAAHKLKSFTLLELTIAMLLVSILATFAYYTLQTFGRISREQQIQKRDNYGFDLLCHRLRTDTQQCDSILYEEDILIFKDSSGHIAYQFTDSLILRDQYSIRVDSFYVVHTDLHLDYETAGKEVSTLVNHIAVNLYDQKQVVPLTLTKTYAAKQLFTDN